MQTQRRAILHADYNNFYASVEALLNPLLRNKPIAVCGSQEDRHGIVLAKSEQAKKYGVKTGDAIWQAKQKCKDILIVPPHFEEYQKYSKMAHELYYDYTDQIEPYGMDECWLDVSGSEGLFGSGREIADMLRNKVKKEFGLTISVGVSFNKIFAKLGSDMKKPDAVTYISQEGFKEQVWTLPATDLLMVGRATGEKLARYGIRTIGELARTPSDLLKSWLGKNGEMLWKFANGLDTSRVMRNDYKAPIATVGHGITCVSDLLENREVFRVFLELAQEVSRRLRDNSLIASGVQITVRDSKLGFQQFQTKLSYPTQAASTIAGNAQELFEKQYKWSCDVRALTVRAINLHLASMPVQVDLFNDYVAHDKQDKIDQTVYEIRKRFGRDSITRAILLEDTKMPRARNDVVTLPSAMYS